MKLLTNVLSIAGLLALSYCAVELGRARLYQAHARRQFAEQRTESGPAQPHPRAGSAVAMLTIPRLGLTAIVVEGAGDRELKLGPGHIPGTSFPGDGGNVGVAGHRDTFFRPLRFIRANDTIQVTTDRQEHFYKVVSTQIVTPDDIRALLPTGREAVTLVTCYPFDFVGAAPRRFIVRADCVDCSR